MSSQRDNTKDSMSGPPIGNFNAKQRKSPMSPLSSLPEPALSKGADVTPPVGHAGTIPGNLNRSTSIHSRGSAGSASATSSPPFPSHQKQSSGRHLSQGAQTRPAPQPTTTQKDMFDMAVASSSLATSSEGLQALLRDHPELVSTTLSQAAGPGWNEVSESTRGSRHGSQPGTPASEDSESEGHVLKEAPSVGEGGSSLGHLSTSRPNLGSTGELVSLLLWR